MPMRLAAALALAAAAAAGDAPPPSDTPKADDAVATKLATLVGSVRTVQGRFTQRTFNPDSKTPELREGSFALEVPDKYNLKWTKPSDPEWAQRLCSDGKYRWEVEQQYNDVLPEQTKKPAGQGDGDVRRILDWVRGDLGSLHRDFVVATAQAADGYEVTLTPKPDDAAAADVSRARIDYDAKGHVRKLAVEMASGTRIEAQVESAQYDQPIPAETFRVGDP